MIQTCLDKVTNTNDLSRSESFTLMSGIMEKEYTDIQVAALVTALKSKGETPEEITGFSQAMRAKSTQLSSDESIILDTCGTGGDGQNTFNISTIVAIVAAAAGVNVAKHGNRAVSSSCGSADLLEQLGVNLSSSVKEAEKLLSKEQITFLYAPSYHSAMKHVKNVRQDLGMRTVFNLLGPLTNPAGTRHQLLGVFKPDLTETFAEVLKGLGSQKAMVVSGLCGSDEISLTGETKVTELQDGCLTNYRITPEAYGFTKCEPTDLTGGSPEQNAQITLDILQGKPGAKRDIILLNTGAALYTAEMAKNVQEGTEIAQSTIDSGRALEKLERFKRHSHLIANTQNEQAGA